MGHPVFNQGLLNLGFQIRLERIEPKRLVELDAVFGPWLARTLAMEQSEPCGKARPFS